MFYLISIIKASFADFKRNKVRTVLTSLGILIGVASVVLLIGLGLGLKKYITNQFEGLGKNLLVIMPGRGLQGGIFEQRNSVLGGARFDIKDVSSLKKIRFIKYIAPAYIKSVEVSARDKSDIYQAFASSEDVFDVFNITPQSGKVFRKNDVDKRSKVVVLGPTSAEKLFGSADSAIGEFVKIEGTRFKVIGVSEAKGSGGMGGNDLDANIYFPYTTGYMFNPDKKFYAIYLKAGSEEVIPSAIEEINTVLGKRYEVNEDFSVLESKQILQVVSSIFAVLNSILVMIGGISLVVGGIGIMNIMYVTVVERIKEIGIRRAVGATKKDILLLFLVESILLSLLGGSGGILISAIAILVINNYFPAEINFMSIAIAFGVSSFIGIIFGVIPAKKASDLSPIEAIRYE